MMEGKQEKKPSVPSRKSGGIVNDTNEKKVCPIINQLKDENRNCGNSPERQSKPPSETFQFSDCKLKKLTSGLGQKMKDIREDIADIRDESLHSLIEIKEVYQEKAEQKKAILSSFTEDEVRNLRKSSPLAGNVTKQMNTLYMSKRLATVRFSVLEGKNIPVSTGSQRADNMYVKFSLGLERFKTRLVPPSCSPRWGETFCLAWQAEEEDSVKVELFARGTKETFLLGTGVIMLKTVTPDTDTRILLTIKGDYGEAVIDVVVWVTGTNYHTKTEDSAVHGDQYRLTRSLENISDVGYLTVQVVQAMGLGSQKLQGSVNPFCVLELDNQFRRTKTLTNIKTPVWEKDFNFKICDAFSVLKVSVANEKMNSPPTILGRAVIPLSSLRNGQENQLMVNLKDKTLRKQGKGDCPRLQLKIYYRFNKIRSAVCTFRNKNEVLYEVPKPKFDRAALVKNVNRIKRFLPKGSTITKMKQSYNDIIAWEAPARTVKYFVFYMFFVYYFQIWWLPTIMLYYLGNNYLHKKEKTGPDSANVAKIEIVEEDDDEDDEYQEDKHDEKKSLKFSFDSLQTILLEFQEGCGSFASYFERILNLFYFEEPFLTFLLCSLLAFVSFVLWMFGLRAVLLFWGVNKFTKKLRDPNPVATNEVDNLILRVPDMEMVEDSRPL